MPVPRVSTSCLRPAAPANPSTLSGDIVAQAGSLSLGDSEKTKSFEQRPDTVEAPNQARDEALVRLGW